MYYAKMFRPKVKAVEIEDDGEKFTFYVRQQTVLESSKQADALAKRKKAGDEPTNVEMTSEMAKNFVVHEDGTSISDEEVSGLMSMSPSAFKKMSDRLVEIVTGEKPKQPGDGEPKTA